jgi:hypothetical protein
VPITENWGDSTSVNACEAGLNNYLPSYLNKESELAIAYPMLLSEQKERKILNVTRYGALSLQRQLFEILLA